MKKILETLKRKWAEYLLEIIVIMIGILGAFTLNNWNEDQKIKKEDIEFLRSLKSEISADISTLTGRRSNHIKINDEILATLNLLDSAISISQQEYYTISQAIRIFPQLTPVHKNIERNDIIIAAGRLMSIDREINGKYLTYLEQFEFATSVYQKLGETLQNILVQHIYPTVDLNMRENDPAKRTIDFDFELIRKDRLVKNALQNSLNMRRSYINYIEGQIKNAEELLRLIDTNLSEQ